MITVFIIELVLLVIMIALSVFSACVYKKAQDLNPKVLDLEELERRISIADDNLQEKQLEYENKLSALQKAEETIAEGEKTREFLDSHEGKIKDMRDLEKEIQQEIDDIETSREEKNKLYNECQQKYTDLKRDTDEQEIKLENLKKDLDSKGRELQDTESRIENKKRIESEIEEKLASKRNERDQLVQDCARYESVKNELFELETRIADLKMEKESLNADIRDLEKKRDYLKQYSESEEDLRQNIKYLEEEKKRLSDDINAKRTERDNLYSECTGYESTKRELEDINEKLVASREEKSSLESSIKGLKSQKEELLKIAETEESLNEKIKVANEKIRNLDDEISEKIRSLGQYDGQQEYYEKLKQEVSDLEYDAKRLQKVKEDHQQYEDLQKMLEGKIWEDLDRPAIEMPNVIIKKNVSETAMLNDFTSKLDQYQIKFDDRIVKAFHTGLKVADASPLVVLSGISGTGKSLLPQLYASAMGMNFLAVPVQPRWDSPQDMFGFFNYMQNKFKATELSRMLWQFDIYNNKEREDGALKKFKKEGNLPMNIVLFDEMNLARVEYYFSDMLSKLEVRRNTDASSDNLRAAAEIEIEGGSISMKDNARRLYVNRNTLFVGTMNEDETTQSLSDKVMDRSNVLRFGKPKDLDVKPMVPEFMDYYAGRKDYLSYEKWQEMLPADSLPSNLDSKVTSIISEINDVMNSIDRPFAYRVSKAIHSYVSAYPNAASSPDAFKHALADQIEMKVLPKLNGIDITDKKNKDAMDRIESLIANKVKDDDLTHAFNKNYKDTEVFFKWKGVVR